MEMSLRGLEARGRPPLFTTARDNACSVISGRSLYAKNPATARPGYPSAQVEPVAMVPPGLFRCMPLEASPIDGRAGRLHRGATLENWPSSLYNNTYISGVLLWMQ